MSVFPHTIHRTIGTAMAALGVAASSLVAGSGPAQAAGPAERVSSSAAAPSAAAAEGNAIVTFTNNVSGGSYICEVTTPNGIGHPPTQPHQLSWRSVVVCGVVVRMYGVSHSYVWGSDISYYPGSTYDITGTIAETVGRVNVPPGAWGLNSNVIIFTPAGYTATPGNGCAAVAADQTKCIATAGPIMVS
ncbi:hypothetical protein CU044_2325 [Streptomyces sp. L-9-10]|uniref:hypothetical protein n=1 Tax=Streptomyces sp. L-9-10 TaxID=1478131 RepID=UPI00101C37A9|nr:hypothetical protein [Streptomyces sp. L-9-10]RYJ29232.1 hypothetical protein CU044_2325 [Streptomyces sp. L-9-10]